MAKLPAKNTTLQLKRGDTFIYEVIAEKDGVVMNLAGVNIRSQIFYKGSLIADCTVIRINDSLGQFQLQLDATVTENFPIGTFISDIQYSFNGQVTSSSTYRIVCHPDITGQRVAV